MKESHIADPNNQSTFTIWQMEEFEKVNPIEKFKEGSIKISTSMQRTHLLFELKKRGIPFYEEAMYKAEQEFYKNATGKWEEEYKKLLEIPLPTRLFDVLDNTSKKHQINALKGISMTATELIAFIIKAYLEHGYTLSQYISTHHHSGLNKSELPTVIVKRDDDKITSIGKTNLSHGQLKKVINERKVIISKFLDKGDKWHCFFISHKSLKGEESYKNGLPHLHYISHSWGFTREDVLTQLRSKHYKLPALPHIDFNINK